MNTDFYVKDTISARSLKNYCQQDFKQDKTLGTTEVRNAFVIMSKQWHSGILDGGIMTESMDYVPQSAYLEDNSCGYEFIPDEIELKGEGCIYLGLFHTCYGHAIIDSLKKLWYVETTECKNLIAKGYELVFITGRNGDLPYWNKRILELAGLNMQEITHLRQNKFYRHIIIPDNSTIFEVSGCRYYTETFENIIYRIKDSVSATTAFHQQYPSKLYFTRTAIHYPNHRETGEKRIEKVFKEKGYEIISPEKHSIEEQVSMLMKCTHFAATEGSCAHGAIFVSPHTNVCVLRKADYVNKNQPMITQLTNSNTTYIDIHHSVRANKKFPMLGPFYMYVTKELSEWAGNRTHQYYFLQPSYWFYYSDRVKRYVRITHRIMNKLARLLWIKKG